MKIVIGLVILSIIVFIHELGHLIFAKLSKIKVNEFAVGMGPKIYGIQKGDTLYSIRALPIGGFCSMEDENGLDDNIASEDSFSKKPAVNRFLTIFAGPLFNFILAFICVLFITVFQGYDMAYINQIVSGSAAESNDLRPGDIIVSVDNKKIYEYTYLISYLKNTDVLKHNIVIERNVNNEKVLLSKDITLGEGNKLGVYFGIKKQKVSDVLSVIDVTFSKFMFVNKIIISGIADLFTGHIKFNEMSGVIGTVKTVGDTVVLSGSEGSSTLINTILLIVAIISSNLGLFNLLPFPALDGGRLVFIIYEMIFRKPVNKKYESVIHIIGFIILIAVSLLFVFKDIFEIIF